MDAAPIPVRGTGNEDLKDEDEEDELPVSQQHDSEAPKLDPGSSDMEWLQMNRTGIFEKRSGEEKVDAEENSLQSI